MSQVELLEQITVLRHQVFVVLNSHKSSLFLCDLVIHCIMLLGLDCVVANPASGSGGLALPE